MLQSKFFRYAKELPTIWTMEVDISIWRKMTFLFSVYTVWFQTDRILLPDFRGHSFIPNLSQEENKKTTYALKTPHIVALPSKYGVECTGLVIA